ncbi:alpha/beta hydrolase [Portibacter lacus]|nr:alpha/beta hydrolase [Portibacter lacus]
MKLRSSSIVLMLLFIFQSCSYFPEDFDRDETPSLTETIKYIKIGDQGSKALIFYPGGLVDPFAYVNMLSAVAGDDVVVFIPKVPYNLAILNINHAEEIKKAFPDIKEWSVGGHSLGGAVACFVINDHPSEYENLFLLAAYPSESTDLKSFEGTSIVLFGSNDGVADLEKLINSRDQFNNPVDVEDIDFIEKTASTSFFYQIEGGNHGNFGNYGFQKGDRESTITREEQQSTSILIMSKILAQ